MSYLSIIDAWIRAELYRTRKLDLCHLTAEHDASLDEQFLDVNKIAASSDKEAAPVNK